MKNTIIKTLLAAGFILISALVFAEKRINGGGRPGPLFSLTNIHT